MSIFLALCAVTQAFFLVHLYRNEKPYWWALAIVFAPGVGCVVYYAFEIFPRSREQRNVQRVASQLAEAFMPNSELQRRLAEAERCPSISNKIAAAEGLMRCGMYHRAVGMYQAALVGPYASDPQLTLGLARAHVNDHTFESAREVLARLRDSEPCYRPEEVRLLDARSLEGMGCHQQALQEYEALTQVFVGLEAKCRYGLLLKRLGYNQRADEVFSEVLAYARRFNIRVDAEQVWIDTAKRSLVGVHA